MLLPKPNHLSATYGAQFNDQSIAEAYRTRPPYPSETFSILHSLMTDEPSNVLELGCGTGDITRRFASEVDYIDAVDPSFAMLETARKLPNGAASNIRWIQKTAEDFEYKTRYALVIAAESLHWMQWDIIFPKIRAALSTHGVLAIILGRVPISTVWDSKLYALIGQYSTNREYKPYDLLEELQLRHLFTVRERTTTKSELFIQSIDDYILSFHSRNGFSQERMGRSALEFDSEVRRLVEPYSDDGMLQFEIVAEIVWGLPTSG